MSVRGRLFSVKQPYLLEETNGLFLSAMRENCAYQYNHCGPYRKILDGLGFAPEQLRVYEDLARLPFLPTLFFKSHELLTMPRGRTPIEATSSGTSGKMSRIAFDTYGLYCGLKMVLRLGRLHGLFSAVPANYVLLGYKHHKGNQTAITKTAFGATLFTPAIHREYALKFKDGGYKADLDGVICALLKYSRSSFPVRLVGFPSYTYFLLKSMDEQGISLKLKMGSRILLGGGWKQFYQEQVEKHILYRLAEKVLGIEEDKIHEFFGAVEHPILYCDCKNHHFHIPAYSRVIIRDANTLEPVKNGETGLVSLLTPMVYGAPVLSVMTDDLGVLHDAAECGCGIGSPYLEIIGRVGLSDIKTCAAGAAELLRGLEL